MQLALSEGYEPWRLDAGEVALLFISQYLGFADLGKIINVRIDAEHAWVRIGFNNPNGQPIIAAELRLVRFGTGEHAPWEVVDTEDSTLTLATPSYGTTVTSPLSLGGRISGVDESLRIQVRQLNQLQPLGEVSGIPAGGIDEPWEAIIPFTATSPAILTVIVSSGGHIAPVERFAIIGVVF